MVVYASSTYLEEGLPEWHLKLVEPRLNQGVRAISALMSERTVGDNENGVKSNAGGPFKHPLKQG